MNLLFANDRPGAYPDSLYAACAKAPPPFPRFQGKDHCEICVVGGGFTGLSAALHLAEAGHDVRLLEAQRAGFGASGRNGGQLGSGHRLSQSELERLVGPADARALWDLAETAKAKVRARIATHRIDCGLQPGVLYAETARNAGDAAARYAERMAREYGYDALQPLDRAGVARETGSAAYSGGLIDWGAGHLDPLSLAFGLARAAREAGAILHEQSVVTALEAGPPLRVVLQGGALTADRVILACNGYLGRLEPWTAARIMPVNNFMVATAPLGSGYQEILPRNLAVADPHFVVNYWRLDAARRLIFGGGESYGFRFPKDIARVVRPRLTGIYPQLRGIAITHAWGGTLAISRSRMPVFGSPMPNVLSGSGYSGHGVALAVLGGALLAEAATGRSAGFDLLARIPARRFPGGARLRAPLLAAAMSWFALRDRIGL